jgi:FlaG/FlaF family flagellin (archaellin)
MSSEFLTKDSSGVSPVIGVVLIVAVVVAVTGLVTVVAFNLADNGNSEPIDASFQLSKNGDSVRAVVYRNENVGSFILENDTDQKVFGPTVGSISEMPLEEGSYILKAVSKNGENEQVLDSLTVSASEIESTVISGSIEVNPSIQGATVKLFNNNTQNLIETKQTDTNGNYEFSVNTQKEYDIRINVTDNQVNIGGDTKRMYAGGWVNNVQPGESVNFDFGNELTVDCQINSKDAIVGYQKKSGSNYRISNPMQTHCITEAGIENQYTLGDSIKDTTGDGLSDYRQEEVLNIDPSVNDTDSDGLDDKTELQVGTQPDMKDTTQDGFEDGKSYNKSYLNASHKNILVEVSYMDHPDIDIQSVEFQNIEKRFSQNGYNIDFEVDSSPVSHTADIKLYDGYLNNYYTDSSIYTNRSKGYLHLLITESLGDGGSSLAGITSADPNFLDGMMVKYFDQDNKTEHFIMHEIGHQSGLVATGTINTTDDIISNTSGDRIDGIDETSKSCSDYTSIMNYNCQPSTSDYLSDGFSTEGWSVIDKYKKETNPLNTEQLCVNKYTCTS